MTTVQLDARQLIDTAIDEYLTVLQQKPEDSLDGLGALARALDRLVMCYHATPDVEPETELTSEAPRADERPIIDKASAAFPDLDWYALVEPECGADQEVGLSMAIGDLAEIAADLIEVKWLFDNAAENDAIWQFRFGYRTHWGRHLHELRLYLHTLAAW
ncbi:MAG TPA: DUF5063 domain-containing protein [Allosphingosinicella sp.]|jgi:hypothetical protein